MLRLAANIGKSSPKNCPNNGVEFRNQMAHLRRGTRIEVHIPVMVTSLDATRWFSEPGVAVLVNPNGCAVQIARSLDVGTAVLLEGLPHDTVASAKVANCTALAKDGILWLVGLALHESGNVWGIEKPPEDWVSRHVAKASQSS